MTARSTVVTEAAVDKDLDSLKAEQQDHAAAQREWKENRE
jgi:hypothetical protein